MSLRAALLFQRAIGGPTTVLFLLALEFLDQYVSSQLLLQHYVMPACCQASLYDDYVMYGALPMNANSKGMHAHTVAEVPCRGATQTFGHSVIY